MSVRKENASLHASDWVAVVKVEHEEDGSNETDEHEQTRTLTLSCNERDFEPYTRDAQSAFSGERSNIESEDPLSLDGNSTSSLAAFDLAAVVKVETDVTSEDGISETGYSAVFFKTETDETQYIKTERDASKSTENPSPQERVLAPSSSTSAVECNIRIKKEEDIAVDDEVFQAITKSKTFSKDEEHSDCGEKSSQSSNSCDQANGSSVWGLCEEGCSVSPLVGADASELPRTRSYYYSRGVKLAHVSVSLKDSKSRPITHTVEKRFPCTYCPAKFRRSNDFQRHVRTHTGERPFSCTSCPAKFVDSSSLKKHVTTHTGEKPFPCTYCPAKFSQSAHLKSHLRIHTNEKPYDCTFCPAKFNHRDTLKVHLTTHTGEKPYSCTLCPAKFCRKGRLKNHMVAHTGEKAFSCPHCPSKFNDPSNLKRHLTGHSDEKRLLCTYCPAKFKWHSSLKCHLATHTDEKPFSCTYCSAKFVHGKRLKAHLILHTGEESFLCTYCPAKFHEKNNLKVHMRIHIGEKRFVCEHCAAAFRTKQQVQIHLERNCQKGTHPP